MTLPPAVIVHGLEDASRALAPRRPVTLLSAPGAGLFLGAGFWQAMVTEARGKHPDVKIDDILDCADATGTALAALRSGARCVVLWAEAPARQTVVEIAASLGALVLAEAPAAVDLETWLAAPSG